MRTVLVAAGAWLLVSLLMGLAYGLGARMGYRQGHSIGYATRTGRLRGDDGSRRKRSAIRACLSLPVALAVGGLRGGALRSTPSGDPDTLVSSLTSDCGELNPHLPARVRALRAHVLRVCKRGGPAMVFQPIVALASGEVQGYEALARFAGSRKTPDEWFAAATAIGMGNVLEAQAMRSALAYVDDIPPSCYLSINVSDRALCSREVLAVLESAPLHRVVIELTEHDPFDDYDLLASRVQALRELHARFALDDVGSGYAGLERIVRLAPDTLKLDRSLVRGLQADPHRQALITAVVGFADSIGADVVAEGIENAHDQQLLQTLTVPCGQGYHLARPTPVPWRRDTESSHRPPSRS